MINSSSYRIHHMHIKTSYETQGEAQTIPGYRQFLLLAGRRNWLKAVLHATAWILIYLLPVAVSGIFAASSVQTFFTPFNAIYLSIFVLVISFTYLNYYWLLPLFFAQKKMAAYFFVVCSFTLVLTVLQCMATISHYTTLQVLGGLSFTVILLICSIFSAVIIHMDNTLRTGKKEAVQIKTSLLNSQVNTHFLFNSLNWIYLLALNASKETPHAIIQLSGMVRYILKEADTPFTDLATELQYIKNYIALQKSRLGNTVSITSSIPVYRRHGKIAPLLLMSFIENAFKHGANPDEDAAISIDISVTENKLFMHVINNKVSPADGILSTGIGIKNTQQRLNLLYPEMHGLEIMENNKIYAVKLSIVIL